MMVIMLNIQLFNGWLAEGCKSNVNSSVDSNSYEVPIFRTRFDFCSEKITSTEMGITKVLNNIRTLGTLSTAWASWPIESRNQFRKVYKKFVTEMEGRQLAVKQKKQIK
jgi:hypothetical protein